MLIHLLQSPLPAENRPAVRASCSCATPLPETGRPALPTRSQRPSSLGAISRDVLDVLFDEPDISEGAFFCICVSMYLVFTVQCIACKCGICFCHSVRSAAPLVDRIWSDVGYYLNSCNWIKYCKGQSQSHVYSTKQVVAMHGNNAVTTDL